MQSSNEAMRKSFPTIILILGATLIVSILFGAGCGSVWINPVDLFSAKGEVNELGQYIPTTEEVIFWLLGSLGGTNWWDVLVLFPFVLVPVVLLPRMGRAITAFSRTIVPFQELPIGILTALLGTPVFLQLLISNRRKNASVL